MNSSGLFCLLNSGRIYQLILGAKHSVCYAAPGLHETTAIGMAAVAQRLGPEMVTVCIDFDERVIRMGYGHLSAVQTLREAGIAVHNAYGLRSGLLIVDQVGYSFTPTPLYLEAEPTHERVRNALRLSPDQVSEALARLSPGAKAIAMAQCKNPDDRARIAAIPVEVGSTLVSGAKVDLVEKSLRELPPVNFDIARQVRVFEPYLQYVELNLTGAAIQRHRLAIPPTIQRLGNSKELEDRLRTTFELIEKGSMLSSKPLEDALNEIRKNFTPSLGKSHGRVVLKAAKPHLLKRLAEFRTKLDAHQKEIAKKLQEHLNKSRGQIIDYYLPRVLASPPDALTGQLLHEKPTEADAQRWLNAELDRVFPSAESLIQEMKLEERFKDVTFETLNRNDFLDSVKAAFSNIDWDKAYEEFRAAGEAQPR